MFLKKLFPASVKDEMKRRLATKILGFGDAFPSFSHCGEDRVLAYLFKKFPTGSFVDVGAFHPQTSSNTFLLYQRGWRGVNIDALPGAMELFKRMRPDDVNLELAISSREEILTYYKIGDRPHEMNGFSLEFQSNLYADYGIKESDVREIPIRARPLSAVLDEHLPAGRSIELLTIDVEGMELQVLASNNWEKYRPVVVMTEHHQEMTAETYGLPTLRFLEAQNYRLICKLPNELIFLRRDFQLTKSGMIAPPRHGETAARLVPRDGPSRG
ncbi:MAG: FkbM family methyltransferase [Fimbriimonadaceae bacterium]|nr:FkbM family methyltransferase [Fimbriimonadaceae bacterium]